MKTKVLYVWGDDDYGALTFEEGSVSKEAMFESLKAEPDNEKSFDGFNAKALEFGEVDPEFIKFIQMEIQDYDDTKHKNFCVID